MILPVDIDKGMSDEPNRQRAVFDETRWTLIHAIQGHDSGVAAIAMEELCRNYWYPLYAYVRRTGRAPQDAEDLTQAFFAQLLSKDFLASVNKERGKLRSFLLTALKRFMAKEWAKANRQKRGGEEIHITIDQQWAENRYLKEPSQNDTPETIFDKQWALTLLDQVQEMLQEEYQAAGKREIYDVLKSSIPQNEGGASYAELGETLNLSAGAVNVAVHRLRKRYRRILLAQIAQTTESDEEINEEIAYLFSIF
jgi:RNA polymerase sigma factor (sigma-70 family)